MSWAFKSLDHGFEWDWIRERAHVIACEDSQGIVAWKGGVIGGVVVADQFKRDTCSVHIAIDNPMCIRGGLLHEACRHLFAVCGMRSVYGTVPSKNAKALKFDTHIGFEEVARVPKVFGEDEDCVVLVMHKADCRWLDDEMREAA